MIISLKTYEKIKNIYRKWLDLITVENLSDPNFNKPKSKVEKFFPEALVQSEKYLVVGLGQFNSQVGSILSALDMVLKNTNFFQKWKNIWHHVSIDLIDFLQTEQTQKATEIEEESEMRKLWSESLTRANPLHMKEKYYTKANETGAHELKEKIRNSIELIMEVINILKTKEKTIMAFKLNNNQLLKISEVLNEGIFESN